MISDALWEKVRLDELTKPDFPICYGVLKPGDPAPTGIHMLRVKDISSNNLDLSEVLTISKSLDEEFKRSRLNGDEILVSVQGTVGRIALADTSVVGFNISRTIAKVSLNENINKNFVRYYLLSPRGAASINEQSGGTTRASLNIGDLKNLEIPVPSFIEQNVASSAEFVGSSLKISPRT